MGLRLGLGLLHDIDSLLDRLLAVCLGLLLHDHARLGLLLHGHARLLGLELLLWRWRLLGVGRGLKQKKNGTDKGI